MKKRYLADAIQDICFKTHKITLLSGPRQCGKTTFARALLKERGLGSYCNWDDIKFRRLWVKDPASVVPQVKSGIPLVVLDEIHKARGWKGTIKGIFDTQTSPSDLLATGSARLNVYKKGGDSLLGRAYHFRMHPFSLAELRPIQKLAADPGTRREALWASATSPQPQDQEAFSQLYRFGGFPEPLFAASDRFARLWRSSRTEKVIREDLRDLSHLPELSRIEMLAALLPERTGSAFSRTALREDLEVSYDTVKRWVLALGELYYCTEIKPWTTKVVRSIKREGKMYLWDWSEVTAGGARFENLVAMHLLKACDFWTDTGEGTFDLHYLKNKEGHEVDFLLTCDRKPWLMIEVKSSDTQPSPYLAKFARYLGLTQAVQLVSKPNYRRVTKVGECDVLVVSASEALRYLV